MYGLDILLVAGVAVALPVCVWRPWIGVLVFTWLGCMFPQDLVGGCADGLPLSKLVAAATLAGLLFTKQRYALPRCREVYVLAALWITFLLSTTLTAINPAVAWLHFVEVSKITLMTVVIIILFQDRAKVSLLLLVIALSIGFHGITGGVWGLTTGFAERLFGPPGSAIADNNELGFAFTIVLPLLACVRQQETGAALRALLLMTFGLSIVALFATYSRGSLVGFCLVLPLIGLQVRTRDVALLGVALAACVTIYLMPPAWMERMGTISLTAHRTDPSGIQRMQSWYVAYRLGLDHPLLGAGFRPFVPAVYERYIPGYSDQHDAHNHFLQVFAEHGFTGLLLFMALLGAVSLRLWHLARLPRGAPGGAWIRDVAQCVGIAVVAFAAGGVFINQPYSDLYFDLVAVTVVLQQIATDGDGRACPVAGRSWIVAAGQRARALMQQAG